MASKISLKSYTDPVIHILTPIKTMHITEPRSNLQLILGGLDSHCGYGGDAHAAVTTTSNGFMTPSMLALIDSYNNQLSQLEAKLAKLQVPDYGIAIWSGNESTIPSGWVKCDGSRGTPDLRTRIPLNWSTEYTMLSTGGTDTLTINANSFNFSHTHGLDNVVGGWVVDGGYSRLTKFGQYVYDCAYNYDWDNRPMLLARTTGAAGSSSSSNVSVKIMPPYIVKWYIMKLPKTADTRKYNITVVQNSALNITTNLGSTATYGAKLVVNVTPKSSAYLVSSVLVNGVQIANGGTVYITKDTVVSATAVVSYGSATYTTPGTYTFTVPTGITRIRVACVGGGGGSASIWCNNGETGDPHSQRGGDGGTSAVVGLISATGGGGGYAYGRARASNSDWNPVSWSSGGSAGQYNGVAGTVGCDSASCNVAYGRSLSYNDTRSDGSTGYGARSGYQGSEHSSVWIFLASGGSGGFNNGYFNVTPGTQYTVTVGGVGASSMEAGTATRVGSGGYVFIEWGGSI